MITAKNPHFLLGAVACAVMLAGCSTTRSAQHGAQGVNAATEAHMADQRVNEMMNAVGGAPDSDLSIVRRETLSQAAIEVGAQQGLREESCAIRKVLDSRTAEFDQRFRFNELIMGPGILPPVITEVRNSVVTEPTVMRIASRVYRIEEPARIVDAAPTWRNWLYVGLDGGDCSNITVTPVPTQLRPSGSAETAFFKEHLRNGYLAGRAQAREILEVNLNTLSKQYGGMRTYYELYSRGMVSAPRFASATEVVDTSDPNTLIVGNTIIRINMPSAFVGKPSQWRALSANPDAKQSSPAAAPQGNGTMMQPGVSAGRSLPYTYLNNTPVQAIQGKPMPAPKKSR